MRWRITLVLVLAAALLTGCADSEVVAARAERERTITRLKVESERQLAPWRLRFKVAAGGILLGGLAWLLYSAGRRWQAEGDKVHADSHGIFPVVRGKVGDVKFFHDPNRAPTPTTLYAKADDTPTVEVVHVLPAGMEGEQAMITSQAQVTQAVRAGVSGATTPPAKVLALLGDRAGLPPVKVLEMAPEHVEKLLEAETDEWH